MSGPAASSGGPAPGPARYDKSHLAPSHGPLVAFWLSLILMAAIVVPIWRPLVLAAAIAGPLGRWHGRFARALHGRRTLSAALFTGGVVLLLLIPIAVAGVIVVEQALQLVDLVKQTVERSGVSGLLRPLPDQVERWLRHRYGELIAHPNDVLSGWHLWSRASGALGSVLGALASATRLVFDLVLTLIAFFFFLRDGPRLVAWSRRNAPLPPSQFDALLENLRGVSKSVIAGNVATGLAQAAVATLGYVIAGVPSPFLMGLLTFIASFIPSVGTAVAAVPAIGLLLIVHRGWWALFLAGWMILLVGTIDNVLRPVLMRGQGRRLHGALVFFALMGGILMFGAMGLVVGPLALMFFLAMTRVVRGPGRAAGPPGRRLEERP